MSSPAHHVHVALPRVLLMGTYLALLYWVMVVHVEPTFGYLGYTYRTPELLPNALVIGFVLLLTTLMPLRLGRPSRFVLWMHFVLATVPSMVVPQFTRAITPPAAFGLAVGVGLAWLLVLALTSAPVIEAVRAARGRVPRTPAPADPVRARRWTTRLLWASAVFSLLLVAVFGATGALVALTEVRSVRLAYREALALAPPGTAYLLLMASNVVNPVALMRSLLERRWVVALVPLLGQVLIYSIGGHRMVLLSIPGVLFLYVWMRRTSQPSGTTFLAWVTGGLVSAAVALFGLGVSAAGLLVLRMFIEPGNLLVSYVDLFAGRGNLYWSYSFLSWLVEYPYDLSPNFLVGEQARGDAAVSANVNLFGDGYISWGWAGIVIECLLLVALVLLLDGAARGVRPAEFCAAMLLPSFALANSNVFTSVLTHGFLVAYLVLHLSARAGSAAVGPSDQEEVPHVDPATPARAQAT